MDTMKKSWSELDLEGRVLVVKRELDRMSTEDWLQHATPKEVLDIARSAVDSVLLPPT